MGSRSKVNLAYIAGFLDGDGSLMFQIKKRKDGNKSRNRFMLTICFYQDTRHEKPLFWIRDVLGIGYISRRKDGISELRINGYERVREILNSLSPFIKFKKIQAKLLVKSAHILQKKECGEKDLRILAKNIIRIQSENYQTRKKRTEKEILETLGLTP